MSSNLMSALSAVRSLGRVPLGIYPTPFHRLDRVSEDMGVNLWVKREDFSGRSLFGGNKVRKLEYLLAEAKRNGCDTVFTYGATQSNHAMQTATAARRCGMRPVLYLGAIVEPKADDVRANLLLDTILGAEIHILPSEGRSTRETMAAHAPEIRAHIARLEAEGHRVCDIPIGGSTPVGAAGFADCFLETMIQAGEAGVEPQYMYVTTGSGGTLAGLAAGRALSGSGIELCGIQSGRKDPATYASGVRGLANRVLDLVGAGERVEDGGFAVFPDYVGPGYEMPYREANDDIRYLAAAEGIFLDPVYSGKSFHGLLDRIRKGIIPGGSTIIYVHTGGATALFSEREIIGDLAEIR